MIFSPFPEWYPNDDFTARAILVYNQAVALASSGDLDKASEVLRASYRYLVVCTITVPHLTQSSYIECLIRTFGQMWNVQTIIFHNKPSQSSSNYVTLINVT